MPKMRQLRVHRLLYWAGGLLGLVTVSWFAIRTLPWPAGSSVPGRHAIRNSSRPEGAGETDERLIETVKASIPAMYKSGRMTPQARQAVRITMDGGSFRVRARLTAVLVPAVRCGAIPVGDAVGMLTTMRDKAKDVEEKQYWEDTIATLARLGSEQPGRR